MQTPGMIPEMQFAVYRDHGASPAPETTFGCVHCLQTRVEPQDTRRFMVSGTVLCAEHTLLALSPGVTT